MKKDKKKTSYSQPPREAEFKNKGTTLSGQVETTGLDTDSYTNYNTVFQYQDNQSNVFI